MTEKHTKNAVERGRQNTVKLVETQPIAAFTSVDLQTLVDAFDAVVWKSNNVNDLMVTLKFQCEGELRAVCFFI